MENPCKKVDVFEVDYRQLEAYIAHSLGLGSFDGLIDSPNDTAYALTVAHKHRMAKADADNLAKILEVKGCESWGLNLVLDRMCCLGFLEPGKYIINVSW